MQSVFEFLVFIGVLSVGLFFLATRLEVSNKKREELVRVYDENAKLELEIEGLKKMVDGLKAEQATMITKTSIGEKYNDVLLNVDCQDYKLSIEGLQEILSECDGLINKYTREYEKQLAEEKVLFIDELERIKNYFNYDLMIDQLKELIANRKIKWHKEEINRLIDNYYYLKQNRRCLQLESDIITGSWGDQEIEIFITNHYERAISYGRILVSLLNKQNNLLINLSDDRIVEIKELLEPGETLRTRIRLTDNESRLSKNIIFNPGHIEFKD